MGFNVSLCELTGTSCQCISHNSKTQCYVPQKNKARKEFIEKSMKSDYVIITYELMFNEICASIIRVSQ